MKGKNLICLLPFLLIVLQGNAAPGADTLERSNNDPYSIRPLKVQLLLLTMDGLNFGCGAQADYQYKRLLVEAQYRKAVYWSVGKPDALDTKNVSLNTLKSLGNFEALH